MLILKCTKKVQAYLDVTESDLSDGSAHESILGAWYVNQFTVDRRKAFIFMSERTYLSFILFGAKKSNSKKALFPDMCLNGLVQLIRLQQIPMPLIGKVIEDCFESRYANTDSKKVLGNLNDLVAQYQHVIIGNGGLAHCNLNEVIFQINRMPQKNLGWKNSMEVSREVLGAYAI